MLNGGYGYTPRMHGWHWLHTRSVTAWVSKHMHGCVNILYAYLLTPSGELSRHFQGCNNTPLCMGV